MKILGIIPARMGSSRYPGKPLKEILGLPMIAHVYYRSKMCGLLDDLYVATCDSEIYNYVKSIDGNCIMTSDIHTRASERTAEALSSLEREKSIRYDVVVMIQGDEPMITPDMIRNAIEPMLDDPHINVINLASPINTKDQYLDKNEIKIVVDDDNNALYFSRSPIPYIKAEDANFKAYKQVCVIPFRRDFLELYSSMKETDLEKSESVDMLRILENGYKVKIVSVNQEVYSVDTEADRNIVEGILRNDSVTRKYMI